MDEPFLMRVEDVFRRGQGRVVMLTGRIERGRVRKGDEVEIVGYGGGAIVPVEGIEEGCGRHAGEASPVALEEGQTFAFRHHDRAAGSGTVTRLPH
ncbi:hypothetical protein [Streptomyces ehimensis]|uniref:Translation elongation factor EFTu-like domain-containing protein n=1 Tax=Streptomyces ehimensis TaxID=68195 RepID=A0ABV9BSI0_9ACTN